MATTYGYGAEFSSDEDIDRLEQQTEAKFGSGNAAQSAKPSRQQIEEIIEAIRRFPAEQEFNLNDEYLIGLLDYYKIQRGPVVDSTRKLYKRLVLKRIRDGETVTNGGSGGEPVNNLNGNSDNNNSINLISKRLAQVEPASSDDDEPMPPVSSQSSVEQSQGSRKFDSRVAIDKPEPMEIDSEGAPITPAVSDIRTTKQVDISSSEDESDKESAAGESSDSEELDITPPKNTNQQHKVIAAQATSKIIASTPIKDSVAGKDSPVTPKDAIKSKSKPAQYTRSQRIATRSSSSTTTKSTTAKKPTDVSSSNKTDDGQPIAQVPALNKSTLASYENCSRSLSKVKLEPPLNLSVIEDENGEIAFGTTINGRKLNYVEKMVLGSLLAHAKKHKKPNKRNST